MAKLFEKITESTNEHDDCKSSILSADFTKLGADCRMVLDAGAQMLHYDVMDGHFVPNISFGVPVLKSLHKGMPAAFYDVHLMISHPLAYAEPFAKAGATLQNFPSGM